MFIIVAITTGWMPFVLRSKKMEAFPGNVYYLYPALQWTETVGCFGDRMFVPLNALFQKYLKVCF